MEITTIENIYLYENKPCKLTFKNGSIIHTSKLNVLGGFISISDLSDDFFLIPLKKIISVGDWKND